MRIILLAFVLTIATPNFTAFAQPAARLDLNASAAIVVEQSTGRVLYGHNIHARRYPASMSKIMTAIVALDHLELNDLIVIGTEINNMPAGYATNIHVVGETVSVHFMLKALMIRSGNETGRTLAIEVMRRITGRDDITYNEAKPLFSSLLNQRAASLGAYNTTFTNPYGLHAAQHVTTAYDMAIISRAYMDIPVLAEIAAMRYFDGDGTLGVYVPGANIRQYSWTNTNRTLPGGEFSHPFMTGLKTGFTTPAGHCLVGSAYFNGLELVSVVFYSQDPGRWLDTHQLINFGFTNFSFREIATPMYLADEIYIYNPRRGDPATVEIIQAYGHQALLSHNEYANITRAIIYDPLLLVQPEEGETSQPQLLAPIEEGEIVGAIRYYTGGVLVFESPLVAAQAVYERTFDSDMDYFLAMFTSNVFTRRALPYWFGVFGVLFGIFGMHLAISASRRARKAEKWSRPEPRRSRYDRR
ncbi:MAG: D-alanyl-D-alanine carboxypeptidase [Defluviitaleaceae bacterium]|nr:D-alanyl-D-alanine carboxypeptidase [Defluviitaleaceae bacterium]